MLSVSIIKGGVFGIARPLGKGSSLSTVSKLNTAVYYRSLSGFSLKGSIIPDFTLFNIKINKGPMSFAKVAFGFDFR